MKGIFGNMLLLLPKNNEGIMVKMVFIVILFPFPVIVCR